MEFEKEMEMNPMTFIPKISNTAMGVTCEPCDGDLALPYDNELHESMQVDAICAAIRQRFDELLIKGKSLIKMGVGNNADFQIDLEENDIESIIVSDKSKSEAQQIIGYFTQQDISIPNFPGAPTRLLQECLRTNQRVMSALIELERTRQGLSECSEPNMNDMMEALSFRAFQNNLNDTLQDGTFTGSRCQDHYSLAYQYSIFREEKTRQITDKSIEKYDYAMNILKVELGEHFDCRLFNKRITQRIKSKLLKLKINGDSKGASKKAAKLISAKTINMLLSNYRVFLTWFIANSDPNMDNPFKDLSVKANKREIIRRRALESLEISALLDYQWSHGSECRGYRDDAQLYIKVALYSGMRLNEIASLRLDDIKQIDGVWVFDLREMVLKSWSAQRTVPIAQYLLDLGLIEHVNMLKRKKKTFLFSEVRSQPGSNAKKGYGEPVSRWFNRTALKNIGIDKEKEQKMGFDVVFHCLRNTFISELVNAGAQHHHIKRAVGHAQDDDVTLDAYADVSKISLKVLKAMIDEHVAWHC
ncbi:MAG: integrase [Roseivirga sp.]|jgi:integrase